MEIPIIDTTERDEAIKRLGIDNPTEEQIATEINNYTNRIDNEQYAATQYQRDRNYPPIEEQLDMIYWDRKNATNNWEESIDASKAEFPKENN